MFILRALLINFPSVCFSLLCRLYRFQNVSVSASLSFVEEDRGDAEDDTEELEEAVDSDDDVIRDLVVLVVLLLNLCRSVSD